MSTPIQDPETQARERIPYAPTLIGLEASHYASLQRSVALLFRIAHQPAYRALVDRGASETARHDAGNFGVFMGYDFHVAPAGVRLIEINTNAGGALLNGLHTAALCDPEKLGCLCSELRSVEEMKDRIVRTFRAELAAARGSDAVLRSVAIADERPDEQFLRHEFELFRQLFAESGIDAAICDTSELVRSPSGGIELRGKRIDLVYLRDTDFLLDAQRVAPLRAAWLADEVVVTPSPREHHLLANKTRLEIFSSQEALQALCTSEADAAFLAEIVPETRRLDSLGLEEAWRTRREWVFKPASGFASRAVYRGDKISRRKLEEIAQAGGFLAQRRIEPGEIEVATGEGARRMKFDVRAYVHRDEILMLGARVYQGQVTNLRSPGGGFSAICVARERSAA